MNKKIKILFITFGLIFVIFIILSLMIYILPRTNRDSKIKQQKAHFFLQSNLLDIVNLSYDAYLEKYSGMIIYSNFNKPGENFINRENYLLLQEFIKNKKYEIKSDKYDYSSVYNQTIGTSYDAIFNINSKITITISVEDLELNHIFWYYHKKD